VGVVQDPLVDGLDTALKAFDELLAQVSTEQWVAATPGAAWTVRDPVSHLVTGNLLSADAVGGQRPAATEDSSWVETTADGELPAAYRATVRPLLHAFSSPGALQQMVSVPFGTVPGVVALHLRTTELIVHGWDLCQATGQRVAFPDELVEQELSFTEGALGNVPPDRSPFGRPSRSPRAPGRSTGSPRCSGGVHRGGRRPPRAAAVTARPDSARSG